MPTYRYRCGSCGEELEVWQSFSDEPLSRHPGCRGKLVKVMSPAGIVLKGSGFYKTDNRRATSGSKSGGSGETGSKTGSTDGASGSTSEKASKPAKPSPPAKADTASTSA